MATAGRGTGTENSGVDIQYVAENVYKDLLIKHVRVGPIIGRMSFSEEHHEAVNRILALESQLKYRQATMKFLRLLHTEEDYLLFVQLLDQANYEYLPKLLRGESTLDPDTHEEHCRLLRFFSQDISEKVDFYLLCPKLVEGGWMDTEDKQLLYSLASSNGISWASKWLVYYVLPKRKDNWLKQFLQVLRDLDYSGLVEWISGEPWAGGIDSKEDTQLDTDSVHDTSVKMNICVDSGAAYTKENNLNVPPMTQIEGGGSRPDVLTEHVNIDINRTDKWVQATCKMSTVITSDFQDDVSVTSSVVDNAMIGLDEIDDLTHFRGNINTGSDICRFDIGKDCYVTVSIWRDTLRIHIRKYYQNNGNYHPSKTGIALTTTQWGELSTVTDDVEEWKAGVIAGRMVNRSRELGGQVFVTVNSWYPGVGIRWFRNSRATRKGIHLSFQQWRRLCECLVMPELGDIVSSQHL